MANSLDPTGETNKLTNKMGAQVLLLSYAFIFLKHLTLLQTNWGPTFVYMLTLAHLLLATPLKMLLVSVWIFPLSSTTKIAFEVCAVP